MTRNVIELIRLAENVTLATDDNLREAINQLHDWIVNKFDDTEYCSKCGADTSNPCGCIDENPFDTWEEKRGEK